MTEEQIAKKYQKAERAYEQHDFETAADIFEELVQEIQHPQSAAYLAGMHYLGLAVPYSREKLYEYLQIANEDPETNAYENVFLLNINMLRDGVKDVCLRDPQLADELSIQGAERMYPFALAQCQLYGLGQYKYNRQMAAKWLKIRADQGDLLQKYEYASILIETGENTTEAEIILRELIELGSTTAATRLAMYLLGKDGGENVEDCITLLNYAEMHNDRQADLIFGLYHQKFTGDKERAKEYLEKAIETNEPEAKAALAIQLLEDADEETAPEYFEMLKDAALNGDTIAQLYTGKLCRDHEPDLAVEMFSQAAKQHNPDGIFELGRAYFDGLGHLEQDYEKAFQLFHTAAERGCTEAEGFMGICYLNGTGVTEDIIAAMAHLRIAAEHDDWNAMTLLGTIYANPATPYCNHSLALECYRRSAEAGLPEAMYQLAKCYLDGTMVARDVKEGLKLLQQAADEMGYPDALYELGDAYLQGKYGLKRDEEKAMMYFQQATQENHAKACLALGLLCKDSDLDLSRQLLAEAATQGMKEAIYELARLEEENGNLIFAFKFYEDASERQYPPAMRALAKFHQEGNLIPDNQFRAQQLLREADLWEQMDE